MKYEKARAEVVLFDNSDVVTASMSGVTCYDTSFDGYDECGDGAQKFGCTDAASKVAGT